MIWIGNDSCVVQVGDQIDRCRPIPGLPCNNPKATYNDEANDVTVMNMFNDLGTQALKTGGLVISLLGNHELLNVMGKMEYVSHKGIEQFKNYTDPISNKKIENGLEGRIHAFKAGNEIGKMIGCTRLPAVIIGSNIFAHAGFIDDLIKEINLKNINGLEKINIKVRKWLLGLISHKEVSNIVDFSENSMFWSRVLGKIQPGTDYEKSECINNIKNVLEIFNVGTIIIGHTPQSFMYSNDINSACSGKIWRVDNGSSSAFNGFDNQHKKTGINNKKRRAQYLEILNDNDFYICDNMGCRHEF